VLGASAEELGGFALDGVTQSGGHQLPGKWARTLRRARQATLDFAHLVGLVGQIRYKPRVLRDHLVDASINGVGFLEPFLALSWTFRVPLHTREVAGSKPAAPIKGPANGPCLARSSFVSDRTLKRLHLL
jgi:hypothetical protein